METVINQTAPGKPVSHFAAITATVLLNTIHTEAQYDHAIEVLNKLMDAGAADEKYALADLLGTSGYLIGEQDNTHYRTIDSRIGISAT